jgi:hypothetical protein
LEKYERAYDPDVLWDEPVKNYEKFLLGHAELRDYLKELRRLVLYNLKGATRTDTPTFLGMNEDEQWELRSTSLPSDQGRVWGRRVSVSHILLGRDLASRSRQGQRARRVPRQQPSQVKGSRRIGSLGRSDLVELRFCRRAGKYQTRAVVASFHLHALTLR